MASESYQLSLEDAVKLVEQKRGKLAINQGFMKQLEDFETKLNESRSV